MDFYKFRTVTDSRGNLMVVEGLQDVPFSIARVYYLWGMSPDGKRGGHAHRKLREVAICLRGACDFAIDDGIQKSVYRLDSPDCGLYLGEMVWRDMLNFTSDCLIAVFADSQYDENDYIRDYEEFQELLRKAP